MTKETDLAYKNAYNAVYRFENHDYYREYMKNYYIKNKAKMAQQAYEYRNKKREYYRKYSREYYKKNRDYHLEYMRNYNPNIIKGKTPIIEYIEGPVILYFT
jgi:hypothetical protein